MIYLSFYRIALSLSTWDLTFKKNIGYYVKTDGFIVPFSAKEKNMDNPMFVQDAEINAREDTVPGICLWIVPWIDEAHQLDSSTLQVRSVPEVTRSLKLDVIKYFR